MTVMFCPKCGALRFEKDGTLGTVFCPDCHGEMENMGDYDWKSMSSDEQNARRSEWQSAHGMTNETPCCPVCGKMNSSGSYYCICGYDYQKNEIKKRDLTAVARKKAIGLIFLCTAISCLILSVAFGYYGLLDVVVGAIVFDLIFVGVYKNKIVNSSGCHVVGDYSEKPKSE